MPKPPGTYRFFYHWVRAKDVMSVHFRGRCLVAKHVSCGVPCESKRSPQQPHLRMIGWARTVTVVGDTAVIA